MTWTAHDVIDIYWFRTIADVSESQTERSLCTANKLPRLMQARHEITSFH